MPDVQNIEAMLHEMDEVKREIRSISSFYGDAIDSLFARMSTLETEIATLKNKGAGTESDPDEGFTPMED